MFFMARCFVFISCFPELFKVWYIVFVSFRQLDEFREKLKEKNSTIDKNDQKSQSLQSEKRRIESEISELREQIETKDRKLTLLQRKVRIVSYISFS